jgi:outer membrane protein assembly factor BamB
MWHRSATAALVALAAATAAPAQVNNVYSKAVPPDKVALERLNLKVEWTANIPVEGRRDSLTQIQLIDDQIFVQTRTGLLIAGDALTGQLQWFAQLGDKDYANTYPVAANSQFVYVMHVTKLHCFHRYTGVVEYVQDVGAPATVGPAADETGVYCVLGLRTGNTGTHRIAVFDVLRPIAISAPAADPNKPGAKDPRAVNPVDKLVTRYAPEHMYRTTVPDVFDPGRAAARSLEAPVVGAAGSRTPSLSILSKVSPPYTLDSESAAPSITVLPSLRQPYRLRNDFQQDIQRTASLGVIPPSLAASMALGDLRPRAVGPPMRWEYGLTTRVLFPLFLTPTRVWAATDNQSLLALNKLDKKTEVVQKLADPISAPPGRAGLTSYVPLGSGYLVAVEGSSGSIGGGANVLWRAPVGGIANRQPFVTDKFVYSHGDHSGVVCVSRANGDLVWRSDESADYLIAANQEFVYVRDRLGNLLVFDAKRPTGTRTLRSAALASINLSEFNINVTNTASDRIYLAADNGLIVCLRDANAKYARPVRVCPEPTVNAAPKAGVAGGPKGDGAMPKSDAEPKKE